MAGTHTLLALLVLCCAPACLAEFCSENAVGLATRGTAPRCRRFYPVTVSPANSETERAVQAGRQAGDESFRQQLQQEQNVVEAGLSVRPFTPAYHHYLNTVPNLPQAEYFTCMLRQLSQAREIAAAVAKEFMLKPQAGGEVLLDLEEPDDQCPQNPLPSCNSSSQYRTLDGSCNNDEHPTWGQRNTRFTRLLPQYYDDGVFRERRSVDGSPLPNVRQLRTSLIPDDYIPDKMNTVLVMQWGQIVTHDVTFSTDQIGINGLGMLCCSLDDQLLPPELLSASCLSAEVPSDDYYFKDFGVRCMSQGRSNATFALHGKLSSAENINTASHFIDGSIVYGSDDSSSDSLREFTGGRLRTNSSDGRQMLPHLDNGAMACDLPDNDTCYAAGDPRVNLTPELTALQTILVREHNRLAGSLSGLNPAWGDDKLYQEARRVVIAQLQHITYSELLPIYLGPQFTRDLGLDPLPSGYSYSYDPKLDPSVINSFTAAAFRVFHSMIVDKLELMDEERCPFDSVMLSDTFHTPSVVERPRENLDGFLRGLTTQPSFKLDNLVTEEVTNRLFRVRQPFGRDLILLDFRRCRDRGIGSYNEFRELCGLPRATAFEEFQDTIPPYLVSKLKDLYKSPDDVDLCVAGVLEVPLPQSLLGPVYHCIVSEQFYRTKFGDKFYYEFPASSYPFTLAQLDEIRKSSLSRLICDNGDNITSIQPQSFLQISEYNSVVDCNSDQIPRLDLSSWQE